MAVELDRLKSVMRAVARGAVPEVLYTRLWRAKLKEQPSTLRVSVEPYDSRIPPMANIPLKVGLPGVEVKIAPGHDVAVGWEDGRPDRPYATLWTPGTAGTKPLEITHHASRMYLGGPSEEFLLQGTSYRKKELAVDAMILIFCEAVAAAIAATPPVPGPQKVTVATMIGLLHNEITQFNQQDYLSSVVSTV